MPATRRIPLKARCVRSCGGCVPASDRRCSRTGHARGKGARIAQSLVESRGVYDIDA
jgi:hypothetical protein